MINDKKDYGIEILRRENSNLTKAIDKLEKEKLECLKVMKNQIKVQIVLLSWVLDIILKNILKFICLVNISILIFIITSQRLNFRIINQGNIIFVKFVYDIFIFKIKIFILNYLHFAWIHNTSKYINNYDSKEEWLIYYYSKICKIISFISIYSI